jgi:3-dehydroquinate synthase
MRVYIEIMKHIFDCQLDSKITKVYTSISIAPVLDHLFETNEKKLFIVDEHTKPFLDERCDFVEIAPGEEAKHMDTVLHIIHEAKVRKLGRDDSFIAVGGGVICDITGFVASLYMRGTQLTLIPTTLLAQVDASLGGKTGVDFENIKNFVGQFYPAHRLYLSPDTLTTLSDKEYKNGLGEVLKHALLAEDDSLYTYLMHNKRKIINREVEILQKMIITSLLVKKSYIERDPKETIGIRASLNLGHTFAHALESVGNLRAISHGEAVAWGVVAALKCSVSLQLCSQEFSQKYCELFDAYEFDHTQKVDDIPLFISSLANDKKIREGKIRFVLMKGQGETTLLPLDGEQVVPFIS